MSISETFPVSYEIKNPEEPGRTYENVALGGTFDHLHAGHHNLLTAGARSATKLLVVGLTGDPLLVNKKYKEFLEPFETRKKNVAAFLKQKNPNIVVEIVELLDVAGPTGERAELQALIVSEETISGGGKINEIRKRKGFPLLDIGIIPCIEAREGEFQNKISSSAIRKQLVT